jgi:exonuclease VII large subunit
MASFLQCSTAQKLQKDAPVEFGQVYAQKWVAGVEGGGSGIHVFIPVKDTSVVLDSMFFRGQKVKLEFSNGDQSFYVGRFRTHFNQKSEMILSSDMKEEAKNELPILIEKMPFEFNDDECVVTYQKGNQTLYYKISNIKIEQPLHYPSAPNGQ